MVNEAKNFDDFYQKITPKLEEIEELRAVDAAKIKILYWCMLVGVTLCILLCTFLPQGEGIVFGVSIVYLLTLFGMIMERARKISTKIRPLFKKDVIRKLLDYFYEDVRYEPRQRMNFKLLDKSLLFTKKVFRTTGDDFTECCMGNTYICFSEVQAYSRSESYFYNGIFIAVKFNKSFKSKTIVIPSSSTSVFKKISLNLFGEMTNASKVKLEDILFNKEFDVISEDQVESRYLLSTSFMQRMIDYKRKVDKKVSFSFIDNWVYVAIPTKGNLFEARISKPITDKDFIRSNYEYFQLLTGLVEDLDLNTKIWR